LELARWGSELTTQLLAHVRHVRTNGFPDAGVEEDGYYSVVISSRTGRVLKPPLTPDTSNGTPPPKVTETTPTLQVVHVVSLEHYDSTLKDPKSPVRTLQDDDRIGLVSLFSWTYTCIPQAVNFVDTMKSLADNMQPLRPLESILTSMSTGASAQPPTTLSRAAQILHDRLEKSYTISRWRAATGEETAAFNRGPLVAVETPRVPAKVEASWPVLSMTGKDYQIFDTDVGMMDLTYSNAWSLGRLAGISDSPFNAALLRFRNAVWQDMGSDVRMTLNHKPSAREVLTRVMSAISNAHAIQPDTFSGPVARINPHPPPAVAPPLSHPDVVPIMAKAIQKAVDFHASASDGETLYSDLCSLLAGNSDWELIHGWLNDCLYLKNIPGAYFCFYTRAT
jgi:hypothetical protein